MWLLLALVTSLLVLGALIARRNADLLPLTAGFRGTGQDLLWLASWLGFPTVGALIVSRRPRNAVGWILVAVGASVGVGLFTNAYARYTLAAATNTLPGGKPAAWLTIWTANQAVLVPFLVFLFPSGRIESRPWRRLARIGVLVAVVLLAWKAVAPGPIDGVTGAGRVDNPLGIAALAPAAEPVTLLLAGAFVAVALASIVHALWRLRTAALEERMQIKWFAFSASLFPVTMGFALTSDPELRALTDDIIAGRALGTETGTWALPLAFFVTFLSMAVSIGIAVFRYRLYDIDRLINRTVVYALLSAGLAGLFGATVVGLQRISRPLTGGDDLAVAISTLATAVMFFPARRRLQTFVDRRFNRSRYDAARAIEAFSARLRDEHALETINKELRDVLTQTMQPSSVSLLAREPTGELKWRWTYRKE